MKQITILLILMIATVVALLFITRKWRMKRKREQIQKLKEDFQNSPRLKTEEPSKQDIQLLEKLVDTIKKAASEDREIASLPTDKDIEIQIETPDVISLKTSRSILHKSFSSIRLEKVEKTEKGFDIHITEN